MTDTVAKYIGKPVLKRWYCEHEIRKQKGASKRFQKLKKKDVFKAGIEPIMVNSLQLKELGVQNTTAVYSWFGKYVILSLQKKKAHIDYR